MELMVSKLVTYHKMEYFVEGALYLFYDDSKYFVSGVHLYNGSMYTNESLNYKATTLKAIRIK